SFLERVVEAFGARASPGDRTTRLRKGRSAGCSPMRKKCCPPCIVTGSSRARRRVCTAPSPEGRCYILSHGARTRARDSGRPAAPVAAEVPDELSKPEEFIWFRLPTQGWKANWRLAVDGSDGFHAVTLHAGSQTIAGGGVPLEDRRVKIVQTSHGVRGVSVDL